MSAPAAAAGAAAGDSKKRKKNFYRGPQVGGKRAKRSNQLESTSGLGFLITFNPRQERRATLAAYSLLNETADRLYGQSEKPPSKDEASGRPAEDTGDNEDIEAELKSLREENYRFSKLRTEIPSIIFISTKLPKPQEISTDMYEHMPSNVQHIVRFLPVLGTCKTQPECVTKKVLEILEEQYPVVLSKVPFLVQMKARHNNEYNSSESRRAFCMELAQKIQEWNSDFTPDLKEPELVINIDILQKVCCVSLLPHFTRFKKYNPEQFNPGPPPPQAKTDEANGVKAGESSEKKDSDTPEVVPKEDGPPEEETAKESNNKDDSAQKEKLSANGDDAADDAESSAPE